MKSCSKYHLFFLIIALPLFGFTQSRNQLQKQEKALQKEINKLNGLLDEVGISKKRGEIAYLITQKKIGIREELIESINQEIQEIDVKIAIQEGEIDSLQRQLAVFREQYEKMLVYAYKNRNASNSIVFVFSASDFNEAYKRLKYLKKIAEYREYQAVEIAEARKKVEEKIAFLASQKERKKQFLGDKYYEKKKLTVEKKENAETLETLQKDEVALKQKIKKKQLEAQEVNKQIEAIILREIELARIRAEEEKKKNKADNVKPAPTNTLKIELNKVDGALSDNFEGNMGKLPWPVASGTITGKFGKGPHPIMKDIEINNNGINILTTKGSDATAIFDGNVVAIIVLPSGGKSAVLIQHGAYFTMYSNLSSVKVKKGQSVKIGQKLGTIKTEDDGSTEIHFELWKGGEKQNPAFWIKKV